MARLRCIPIALVAVLLHAREAAAEPVCGTPEAFNAAVQQSGGWAESGTLSFTITGLVLAGIEKHHLALLADGRHSNAMGNACVGIDFKTWGDVALPQDVGTVKEELFNVCCASDDCALCEDDRDGAFACETWAGPRPSDVAFTGPEQSCDITLTITPASFGYDVACTPGTSFGFVEPNRYALGITDVQIPIAEDATVTDAEFCWELGDDPGPGPDPGAPVQVAVQQDVTVSPAYPDAVFPVPADLAVGLDDGAVYLMFDLADIGGTVTSATLYLHGSMDPSADGNGGDVFVVDDVAWSEATLVWSARPPTSGSALGHLPGPEGGNWVSLDVGAALDDPGVYAFAIVPGPTDTNGAHYDAKEVSPAVAPYLEIVVEPAMGTGSEAGDAGSSGEASGTGEGTASEGGDTTAGDGSGISGGNPGTNQDGASTGCGCVSGDERIAPSFAVLALVGLAASRRRRRSDAGAQK